jgi:DNA-binding MarR family transcriptional regulator
MELFMRHSMQAFVIFTKQHGVNMSQMSALFFLSRRSSCGVTELGEHLGVSNAAASQLIERLVQLGFLARSEDPQDRRGKHIALTHAGESLLESAVQARLVWTEQLIAALSETEAHQVAAALQTLIEKDRLISAQDQ